MANFTAFQLRELNNLLNESGYTPLIANSNSEFSEFFAQLGINIYENYNAGSKGQTLLNFWKKAPNNLALLVIENIEEIVKYELSDDLFKLEKFELLFKSIKSTLSNNIDLTNKSFSTIKEYNIIKELTPGGFGDTYLLDDIILNKKFVLKKFRGEFIKPEDNKKFLSKFFEEIRLLYDLNHINIVRVFDYSNKNSAWYIMEYVDGGNISEYVKTNPQNLGSLFLQTINVFSFLESKKICHRDIRENNLLVNKNGVLKIIDFGFGKIIEGNGTLKDTTKMINYPYILPKELNCEDPKYTQRTEVYFVGQLFQKLITDNSINNFPYEQLLQKMIQEDPRDRIESFLYIKNLIREINLQYEITPKNLKQNYQDLITILDNIIATKNSDSLPYDYEKIVSNLELLLDNNYLNDKLDNPKFFAECFLDGLAEWYPKRKEISIKYLEDLIKWLKSLDKNQKEQFIKNLHFKLNNYENYQDLPF